MGGFVLVLRQEREILLVKPRLTGIWQLPGGGVERGETVLEASLRELWEEARYRPVEPLRFFALYHNPLVSCGDHVVLYVSLQGHCDAFHPHFEIADCRYFPIDQLPDAVAPSVRMRLAEWFGQAPVSPLWSVKDDARVVP